MTTPTTRPMNATDRTLAALHTELASVNERRDRLNAAISALTIKTVSTPKLAHSPRRKRRHPLRGDAALARNTAIIAQRSAGRKVSAIARDFKITPTRVLQILAAAPTLAEVAISA